MNVQKISVEEKLIERIDAHLHNLTLGEINRGYAIVEVLYEYYSNAAKKRNLTYNNPEMLKVLGDHVRTKGGKGVVYLASYKAPLRVILNERFVEGLEASKEFIKTNTGFGELDAIIEALKLTFSNNEYNKYILETIY